MDIYEKFLSGKVEAYTLFNEFSFQPREFADKVVEIILNSSINISDELEEELRAKDFDVETISDGDRLAFVRRGAGRDIKALGVDVSMFESFTEKVFNYTAVHEAGHIVAGNEAGHTTSFFRMTKQLLEDNFNFDEFKELFERDVLITGDKRSHVETVIPEPRIFLSDDIQRKYAEVFANKLAPLFDINQPLELLDIKEIDDDIARVMVWQNWNGRVDMRRKIPKTIEGGIDSKLRVSRGRGKSKLPLVSLDLKTGAWEVLEEERWFVIRDFDIERPDVNVVDINLDLETAKMSGEDLDSFKDVLGEMSDSFNEFLDELTSL